MPPRRNRRHLLAAVTLGLALGAVGLSSCQPQPPPSAPEGFDFVGGGYGHGVGMSQYGAQGRGLAGHSAAEILDVYYPGTELATRATDGPRVLIGNTSMTTFTPEGGSLTATTPAGTRKVIAGEGQTVKVWKASSGTYARRISPGTGELTLIANRTSVALTWAPDTDLRVSMSGHRYRWGRVVLEPVGSSLDVVVGSMSMDQYLFGVAEMPLSWTAAALQSQAIAARTFAARRVASPRRDTYDMFATTADQHWTGAENVRASYGSNWIGAVTATSGQVLLNGSSLAQTYYTSSNGGYSEASSYVWVASIPYLVAKKDRYDAVSSNSNSSWVETYTNAEVSGALVASGRPNVGTVKSIKTTGSVGTSGRVDKAAIKVTGTRGTITLTGNQLRSAMNARMPFYRDLLSTKFVIEPA